MNLFNFFFHAHNKIAENGADKVLSSEEENSSVQKAYVNFPTSRKRALDVPLYAISSGRSMVEMLGVLAIIGVLSVGAISGYSKAMMKYKLNKQLEQMNQLINMTYTYGPKIDTSSSMATTGSSYIPYFKKLNLIPDGMTYANSMAVFDALKTNISVYSSPNSQGHKIVYIAMRYDGISDKNIILQSCIQNMKLAKEYAVVYERNFYMAKISNVDGEGAPQGMQDFYGSSVVSNCKDHRCLKDASLNDIYKACSDAMGKNLYLTISFYFR